MTVANLSPSFLMISIILPTLREAINLSAWPEVTIKSPGLISESFFKKEISKKSS